NIDGRSDLYSLGVVTYQMLTGKLPFNAPSVAGILMQQITGAAPDIRRSRPDIPEDLALAVARCLEKDPESRWPTADALRRALETRNVGDYQPTSARRAGPAGERATARAGPGGWAGRGGAAARQGSGGAAPGFPISEAGEIARSVPALPRCRGYPMAPCPAPSGGGHDGTRTHLT